MRKLFFLLLITLLVMTGVSYADSRIGSSPRQSIMVIDEASSHVHVATSPVDVYRITLTAESTGAFLQLINSATIGVANTVDAYISAKCKNASFTGNATTAFAVQNVKADVSVGTAGQTLVIDYGDNPLRLDQGLLAGFAGNGNSEEARAVIEYSPVVN